MNRQLVTIITGQTKVMLRNMRICLKTCIMEDTIYGMPMYKHVYHALHSLDRWFVNPDHFDEPPFHEPNLNSLDIASEKVLSREQLEEYLNVIEQKILTYLDALTDEQLSQKPEGSEYTRLTLILVQFKHLYAHLGMINCNTIQATGRWPRVIAEDSVFSKENELYE